MLPSFHISNLRQSPTTKNEDALVGSSLELAQRLHHKPDPYKCGRCSSDTGHHSFKIEDEEEVQQVWCDLQRQTRLEADSLEDKRDSSGLGDFDSYRIHHFIASNSPQLQPSENEDIRGTSRAYDTVPAITAIPNNSSPALKLTMEGKRQAEAARTRLRRRTLPIRHLRSQGPSSEKGVCKDRWSSYTASRMALFDKNISGGIESKGSEVQQKQSSLLEVFESELAKKPAVTDRAVTSPKAETLEDLRAFRKPEVSDSAACDSLKNSALVQTSSDAVEAGIRTAVTGFETCIRGIISCLQANEDRPGVTLYVLNGTLHAFQSLARDFATCGKDSETKATSNADRNENTAEIFECSKRGDTFEVAHAKGPVRPWNQPCTADTTIDRERLSSVKKHCSVSSQAQPPPYDVDLRTTRCRNEIPPRFISDIGPLARIDQPLRAEQKETQNPPFQSICEGISWSLRSDNAFPEDDFSDHSAAQETLYAVDDSGPDGAMPSIWSNQFPYLATFESPNSASGLNISRSPHRRLFAPEVAVHPSPVDRRSPASAVDSTRVAEANERSSPMPPSHITEAPGISEPETTRYGPLRDRWTRRTGHGASSFCHAATVAKKIGRCVASVRPPYSETLSGEGRFQRDSFLGPSSSNHYEMHAAEEPLAQTDSPLDTNRTSVSIAALASARSYEHHDDASVGSINSCTEKLKELGFDHIDDARLLIYAQAANGEIGDALDTIEEDERASWEQY
ncbi:MAG: hypothetical protein Q9217_000249 [Psora testacea]